MTCRMICRWKSTFMLFAVSGMLAAGLPARVLAESQAKAEAGGDSLTPQKMQNPIELRPKGINILFGPYAMHSPDIQAFTRQPPRTDKIMAKNFWLTDWKTTGQKIAWNVSAAEPGEYRVTFMIAGPKDCRVRVSNGNSRTVFLKDGSGWQREEAKDALKIPAGKSVVELQLEQDSDHPLNLKSIELVNVRDEADLQRRIQAFKGDVSWTKDAGYGIMTQCGGWSYPPQGDKKPWPGFAEDFDAKTFVRRVDEMGGKFVVWSATWIDYLFPAPIEAIREILPNRVSRRDLIADLIKECKARDMRFMMYYHLGHGHVDVLTAKGWNGLGQTQDHDARQKWLAREEKIFREIGARYGEGLSGIFLDDGSVWYPADFEKLGAALKTGNPKRIITYNPFDVPRVTPFQDFYCGEGFSGRRNTPFKLKDGVVVKGPYTGLQLWGNFVFDGPNWGIHLPNTKINPPERWSADDIVDMIQRHQKERYSVAFDLLMYENGEFGRESYEMLKEAAQKLGRGPWGDNRR